MADDMTPNAGNDERAREEVKAQETALLENFEKARLSGDLDGAKTSLAALIKSLTARGIDTTGLDASGGGGTDVGSLQAMINDVGSKSSAAGGKETQADLRDLGTLAVPALNFGKMLGTGTDVER